MLTKKRGISEFEFPGRQPSCRQRFNLNSKSRRETDSRKLISAVSALTVTTDFIMMPFPAQLSQPRAISFEKNALENIRHYRRELSLVTSLAGLDKASEIVKLRYMYLTIGQAALSIIDNLFLTMTKEEQESSDVILSRLENYFLMQNRPNTNVLLERLRFNEIVESVGENLHEYASRIWYQASKCQFKDSMFDDLMRDRFIAGLQNENLMKFLVSKNCHLTFHEALSFAKSWNEESNLMPRPMVVSYPLKVESLKVHNSPWDAMPPTVTIKKEVIRTPPLIIENDIQNCDPYNVMSSTPIREEKFIIHNAMPSMPIKEEFTNRHSPLITIENDIKVPQPMVQDPHASLHGVNNNHSQTTDVSMPLVKPPMEFEIGAYIVLKKDLNKNSKMKLNVPIWRVDSAALLEKYLPLPEKGTKYYRSTAEFRGWSSGSPNQYERVNIKNMTKKLDKNQREFTMIQLEAELFSQNRKRKSEKSS